MSWSLGLAEWDRLSWSCFTLGTCALYNEQISKIISIVTCFINNDSFLGKIMSMLSCKSRRFFCNYSQHLCLESPQTATSGVIVQPVTWRLQAWSPGLDWKPVGGSDREQLSTGWRWPPRGQARAVPDGG